MLTTYNISSKGSLRLPPFVPGTTDLVAIPNPTYDLVCVRMPYDDKPLKPAMGQPWVIQGGWHLLHSLSGKLQSVPEFEPDVTHDLSPASPTDPRAVYMRGFWEGRGHQLKVQLATGKAKLHVLGRVSAAAHCRLVLTDWGVLRLAEDMLVLTNAAQTLRWLVDKRAAAAQFKDIVRLRTRTRSQR
ncbi:MAG TPA: hypothetical protein VLA88_05350 [Candidatus Saccharimonadales bacterium]|nr:hypothetical protein [Candidatus Saccharimonadales bacterium]